MRLFENKRSCACKDNREKKGPPAAQILLNNPLPPPTAYPYLPLQTPNASRCKLLCLEVLSSSGNKRYEFWSYPFEPRWHFARFLRAGRRPLGFESRLSRPRSPPSSRRAPRLENRQFIETVHRLAALIWL